MANSFDRSVTRRARHARWHGRWDMMCALACGAGLFAMIAGCDRAPSISAEKLPAPSGTQLVRLPPEELARSGVTVQSIGRAIFRTYRDFPGIVRPNDNALADITPLVRGRVVEVHADLGQTVVPNQVLAVLYSSDLGLAQSVYLKARARRHVAEQAYQRAQYLLEEKVIGQAEAQRREGEMISIRAEAQEARERLRLLGMSDQEIRLLEQTQTIRSQVHIVAPFAGRVIARNITKGEVVETSQKLFVVADLSTVWVVGNVSEKDISYVHQATTIPDQSVEVQVAAYPGEAFQGIISYVGDVLDPATRTMQVRLKVANTVGRLKPEMFASIRIASEPAFDVLVIPEAAVQQDRDRSFVFVQQEVGVFESRTIRLGSRNGTVAEVLDGVREGDMVVTDGAFILKFELLKPEV